MNQPRAAISLAECDESFAEKVVWRVTGDAGRATKDDRRETKDDRRATKDDWGATKDDWGEAN